MAEVALLGTGRMGSAMVRKLAAAGHNVTVWNRSYEAARTLADSCGSGVTVATTPAEAVAAGTFVLSVLADGRVTREVALNADVLAAYRPGTIFCDMATGGYASAVELDARLTQAGVRFVDAPVSGSVPTIESGQLLVIGSGDSNAIDEIRPVLEAFARLVLDLGPAGSGQVMKLAVNLVVYDLNAAVSEGLNLAEKAGVPREIAYSVFEESVVAAPYVKYKRPAFVGTDAPVAMSLQLVQKDFGLIAELAAEVSAPIAGTRAVAELVAKAVSAGFGAEDMAALSRHLDDPH